MSEPQIPKEVWGIADTNGRLYGNQIPNTVVGFTEPNGASHYFGSVIQWTPVLIGGSALLDEVTKLRRVAEAAVKHIGHDDRATFLDLAAALLDAGYPKLATTGTEDKT